MAAAFASSLLFNAQRDAPPMETPPSSPSLIVGKYAVPTSKLPLTSCKICFRDAVEPRVIAAFPEVKSVVAVSLPARPTFGATSASFRAFHSFKMLSAPPLESNSTAVAAASRPFPLSA